MGLLCIGLDYKCASIDVRGKISFTDSKYTDVYSKLKRLFNIDGSIILSTCNRTEIYICCEGYKEIKSILKNFIKDYFGLTNEEVDKFYSYEDDEAITHIFHVASGLESMIIGEDQILGQVKEAHERAMEKESSNSVLNRIFRDAVTCAKDIKNLTGMSNNKLSLASIAIDTLKSRLGSFEDKSALIVGVGDMSKIAISCLLQEGIESIYLCNRTSENTKKLLDEFPNVILSDFAQRYEHLNKVDIVVTATSAPHLIFEYDKFKKSFGENIKVYIIDMAVPKDVDCRIGELDNVVLYDVDYFKEVSDNNMLHRKKLIDDAKLIIDRYIKELNEWLGDRSIHQLLARIDIYTDRFISQEAECLAIKHNYKESLDMDEAKNYAMMLSNRVLKKMVLKLKNINKNDTEQFIEVMNQLIE